MTAWLLLKHSILMLLRNRIEVLRITAGPIVLICALGATFVLMLSRFTPPDPPSFDFVALIFMGIVGIGLLCLWPIVAWHRFVLGEEPVRGYIPQFRGDRILGYCGTGLLLGLLVFISMIPVIIVTVILASILGENLFAVLPFISPGLAILPTYIMNRLSVVLVASALGRKDFCIKDAWSATAGATDTIVILSIIMVALQTGLETVAAIITGTLVGSILLIVATAALALIQVSLLTTLYGYFVEKRPI